MRALISIVALLMALQANPAMATHASLLVTATVLGRCDIELGAEAQSLYRQCAQGSSINQISNTADENGYTVQLSTSAVDTLSIKTDGHGVALGSLNTSRTLLSGRNAIGVASPPSTVMENLTLVSVEP